MEIKYIPNDIEKKERREMEEKLVTAAVFYKYWVLHLKTIGKSRKS